MERELQFHFRNFHLWQGLANNHRIYFVSLCYMLLGFVFPSNVFLYFVFLLFVLTSFETRNFSSTDSEIDEPIPETLLLPWFRFRFSKCHCPTKRRFSRCRFLNGRYLKCRHSLSIFDSRDFGSDEPFPATGYFFAGNLRDNKVVLHNTILPEIIIVFGKV